MTDEQTRVTEIGARPVAEDRAPGGDCVVVIYTKEPALLGKRFVLDDALKIGRDAENTVVLGDDSVSRRHARIERRGANWVAVDNKSTNGTYVEDDTVAERALVNGDRIRIGHTIFKYLSGADVEAQYHEAIVHLTMEDALTRAFNKRYLLEILEKEVVRARRQHKPLVMMMLDIDYFKKINDTHGHLAGDYVLQELSRVAQQQLGVRDGGPMFGRYGGEEFAVALPDTEKDIGLRTAEELRAIIEKTRFVFQGDHIAVTVSIGGCVLEEGDQKANDVVRRADEKLYEAKRGGRNRVIW